MKLKVNDELIDTDEEDVVCANCGTTLDYGIRHNNKFFIIDNKDFLCSKTCFKEYAESYFGLTLITKQNITE